MQRVAADATRQRGPVTHRQLIGAGLDRSTIHRRSDRGELHRVHRAVYVVGHQALPTLAREAAAVLACAPNSLLSHSSAACVWELIAPENAEPVHVTVVGRKARHRAGIRVHRTEQMPGADIRRVHGLPVTSPIRTILDLAAINHPQLERALTEAHVRGLLKPAQQRALLKRAQGRRGANLLRALIEAERSGFTRSEAERTMRRLLKQARLPQPRTNARIEGYEVDFLWPEHRLIVEVDGYSTHGHRRAFERDRRKDATLVTAGYRVIRITWSELTSEPLAVATTIATAIAAARSQH